MNWTLSFSSDFFLYSICFLTYLFNGCYDQIHCSVVVHILFKLVNYQLIECVQLIILYKVDMCELKTLRIKILRFCLSLWRWIQGVYNHGQRHKALIICLLYHELYFINFQLFPWICEKKSSTHTWNSPTLMTYNFSREKAINCLEFQQPDIFSEISGL